MILNAYTRPVAEPIDFCPENMLAASTRTGVVIVDEIGCGDDEDPWMND